MNKISIAMAAAAFVGTPALAATPDWWLVSGQAGDSSVQFIDASSIRKNGGSVSFDVATYWGNGRNMERALTMNCNKQTPGGSYSDLQMFACGSDKMRMSTGVKLGSQSPEWVAKTVLAMPS